MAVRAHRAQSTVFDFQKIKGEPKSYYIVNIY